MANLLTGDYEAVVQIAVRQINGLLATLHQNGAAEDAPLRLLHSVSTTLWQRPPRPSDVEVFGDWVLEYQLATHSPGGVAGVRKQLTGMAPAGVARRLENAFAELDEYGFPEEPEDTVRGRAIMQLSSLALSVPEGSTFEVTLHANVRAHYYPAPGTNELPAPIHGEVQVGFEVRQASSTTERTLIIQASRQDNKIQFVAAPGTLDAEGASRIARQLRRIVRNNFNVLPVDLPPEFPFSEFKGVGTGAGQAVALPLQLSRAEMPAGAIQSITHSFIGSSGFAFAARKEYVENLIDVEAIRESITHRHITIRVFGYGIVTYSLHFSSGPTLTFRSGAIEVSGRVVATSWAPDGWVEFKQAITLVLDPSSQIVQPQRLGEPDVDDNWVVPHGLAVDIVRSEVDKALEANRDAIRRVFDDAREDMNEALSTFDDAASARYTSVEITPDGVVVRGEIGGAGRAVPVVDLAETENGAAFTAFQSWVPGGSIERLFWSWVEHSDLYPSPWSGVVKSATDEHRFIFPKPPGITDLSQICLQIEGTQILPGGQTVDVVGGSVCRVPEPPIILDMPAWWEPVTVPVWRPDVTDADRMRDVIGGHVTVQIDHPRANEAAQNSLVYFVDGRADDPLRVLADALPLMRRQKFSLAVIVVVPTGTFDGSRRELEAKLKWPRGQFPAQIHVTEDDEGGWTRTFGASRIPSIFLIDAQRRCVWNHEGVVAPKVLAAALDEHLVPIPRPRARPLRLTVAVGDRAPNALFRDEDGHQFALHRLRGRQVLLNFWQWWSAPCLTELRRLQALHSEGGKEKTFVAAFHGNGNGKVLSEIRRRLGLTFVLVQDSDQRIARDFGVRCWPTTVLVNAEGQVAHVQFGIGQSHHRTRVPS